MAKKANQYLEIHPYKIIETGFHSDEYEVSEALFSLSNEYMGARGYFDEEISLKTLRGSYFNGIYDYSRETLTTGYKGIVTRTHFMVNAVDYFKVKLCADGETLDLSRVGFSEFRRELSLLDGHYVRSFLWHLKSGGTLRVTFRRFLSLTDCHNAFQRIELQSDRDICLRLELTLDNDLKQWGGASYFQNIGNHFGQADAYSLNRTTFTHQKVLSYMSVDAPCHATGEATERSVFLRYEFDLTKDRCATFTRYVTNLTSREGEDSDAALLASAQEENARIRKEGYESFLRKNREFFDRVYAHSDIEIAGNDADQQGIRYCIFMLNTTYHGYSPYNNIGAKGLTGEAYSGHAFWDSETYCLPYYLFNNLSAARNLILFRYHTLKEAKERAKELDCRGACFPVATLNGKEACTLWQHASLQLQPSTAVAYAIFHYYHLSHDEEFLLRYGYELLLEIAKFLLDRGQYNQDRTAFGYYAVMGPDEFKMMVNNNAYTNMMAKFTFEYLLRIRKELGASCKELETTCGVGEDFFADIREAADKMILLYDEKTHLFEQNEGFFRLPHIDIHKIPQEEFPLYSHWTYDRIYRGDMIKQPDVLMFLFLFMSHFDRQIKEANYRYYEPRCIHESSLSPSVHSIFACELGMKQEAIDFFGFASRLDLDNYNNNTGEGLHMTSIAAAWMNIVYGFGGLRSDGDILSVAPSIPSRWNSYCFRLSIHSSVVKITVSAETVRIEVTGEPVQLKVYDTVVRIKDTYETHLH